MFAMPAQVAVWAHHVTKIQGVCMERRHSDWTAPVENGAIIVVAATKRQEVLRCPRDLFVARQAYLHLRHASYDCREAQAQAAPSAGAGQHTDSRYSSSFRSPRVVCRVTACTDKTVAQSLSHAVHYGDNINSAATHHPSERRAAFSTTFADRLPDHFQGLSQ